ncbi:glycoside hydrolase family protein [Sphingomonas sp. R1]|uniref:glycoside hydrolase family protein n=1 Tax=Sphingomonas sp. R1 TaxID=399176 RepID=UPI00222599E7|nr:glycoside hydrolase family protein [Sphingomonas sp. R1]UYY78400.1 glycoside hydrolase family protein [Sphingomonas sp. R1]
MSYNRDALAAELIRDEDERLKVYRCTADKRTIGIGRNLDDVGISKAETAALGITVASVISDGITREQSRALLANDIAVCERQLDAKLPWWRGLCDVRQRVLLNMCFNLGINRLLGFKNTLAKMQRGDFAGAAAGMRASLWARQVGARSTRLAAMMEKGTA